MLPATTMTTKNGDGGDDDEIEDDGVLKICTCIL